MSWSVNELQKQIAIELDQSDSAATEGGTDWNIRLQTLNRAVIDWANTYDWKALHKTHFGLISTSTGNASYALPSDFRRPDGFPKVGEFEYSIVGISKNRRYTDTDYYVNILGNEKDTKVMYIHSGNGTLASGASVSFTYWSWPASLASANDFSEIPDPSYLVQRSLYYLYKAREDGRFPEARVEADKIMARMIENEGALGLAEVDRRVSVGGEKFPNFRLGRDG
jgi:hypothetical protein